MSGLILRGLQQAQFPRALHGLETAVNVELGVDIPDVRSEVTIDTNSSPAISCGDRTVAIRSGSQPRAWSRVLPAMARVARPLMRAER